MATQDEMKAYLATLEPEIADLYKSADGYCQTTDDTLSEEFQLAASIVEVFRKRIDDKK